MLTNERLVYLRKSHGLMQNDVANYLNLSRVAYCHYETGRRRPPSDVLVRLSRFYNVSVDEILGTSFAKKKR